MNAALGYLLFALNGAFAVNAAPHLAKGLTGERFYTPWSRPRGTGMSSPLENVLWGFANLAVAALLYRHLSDQVLPHGRIAFAAGALAMGSGLAVLFGARRARL